MACVCPLSDCCTTDDGYDLEAGLQEAGNDQEETADVDADRSDDDAPVSGDDDGFNETENGDFVSARARLRCVRAHTCVRNLCG